MNATEMLSLNLRGYSYADIAAMTGLSRNAVAGKIYRLRCRSGAPAKHGGFRDPLRVAAAVAMAERIGEGQAGERLGIDRSQLRKWRQLLSAQRVAA